MATTATPDHTMAMDMAVDTMVDTTDTPTVMVVATDTSARGPLMPNPKLKLMPNPRPRPPLMPTMATTATPHTTVDTTVVDSMVDTLAVITVMVDTTDTPTLTDTATDISARGPLMPNPKLMLMPAPMPGMATTDMATVDTMVDTMVDTGVKLVNSTPNHFFHPKP